MKQLFYELLSYTYLYKFKIPSYKSIIQLFKNRYMKRLNEIIVNCTDNTLIHCKIIVV